MNSDPDNLPQSLLHSIDNKYSRDTLIDLSESLLDITTESALKGDTLTKLPIVGWIVAAGKGVLDMRDRLYIRKLLRFLAETSDISEEDRKRW